ncbi:8-amino-7-oxononanoate synthase [Dendrobium catenatum]|uniref:8-amino-7-oxononanoate synthase n=1 Tax=Dendrobium catenatum TaxID=906689 RepID=A0A2I0XIH7_9ASPA|nr:8-amino-7-oxononanoate synthase [Dendrobium catenatum]
MENWDSWISAALSTLSARNLLRSTRPINLPCSDDVSVEIETFDGPRHWDRASVEVELEEETFRQWLGDLPLPSGGNDREVDEKLAGKMLLFSGNDYLGLSTHPAVRTAAAMASKQHGMGPRGSALICGYTNYHCRLEASLAELKNKEAYIYLS